MPEPGFLRMFLSGMLAGGGVSLNTLRPVPSIHCHWAMAAELQASSRPINKGARQDSLEVGGL